MFSYFNSSDKYSSFVLNTVYWFGILSTSCIIFPSGDLLRFCIVAIVVHILPKLGEMKFFPLERNYEIILYCDTDSVVTVLFITGFIY